MAPMLYNLYACVFVEIFLVEVEGADGVGVTQTDRRLFGRYTSLKKCNLRMTLPYLLPQGLRLLLPLRDMYMYQRQQPGLESTFQMFITNQQRSALHQEFYTLNNIHM